MANSSPEHSFSEDEIETMMNSSSSLSENKSMVLIIREQVEEKEAAVKSQQIALDLKDENLKDCQANLKEYDTKISDLEAQIRYFL